MSTASTIAADAPLKVIAGAPDRPLVIGEIEIQCYVLEDESRVLSLRGVSRALGLSYGGSRQAGATLPRFAASKSLSRFISEDLRNALNSPILFENPLASGTAHGYPAQLLVDLCTTVLEARDAGALHKSQEAMAQRADVLVRGLATVGVIALVDEATGYQRIRNERALAAILERYIAIELQQWTRTFPYEFYEQVFRLRGWDGPSGHKRPPQIGRDTNDIVYRRLAPGVLEELRRRNPKQPAGYRKHRHHQWLTPDLGHPKLREHLLKVIVLMQAAPNWRVFMRLLNRALPRINDTIPLPLDDELPESV